MDKLHIITAVHNRFKITEEFISDLKKQTFKNHHLILVDDGSTDGTDKMVINNIPDSTIIYGNGKLWWGGALNEAYKWVLNNLDKNDEYIMISNDDIHFSDQYIENAIELLKSSPNTLITGRGYSSKTGELIDGSILWDFKSGKKSIIQGFSMTGNCASTRSLFMRVGDFKKIGKFHPFLLPHYGSDYEWTLRAATKGLQIMTFPTIHYSFDEGTTGDNNYEKMTLKKMFSKRSCVNPFYKLNFILLATPLNKLPITVVNQIKRYFQKLAIFLNIVRR